METLKENLEETLKRISKISRDLHAEMVVQREEGHYKHFLSPDGALHRQYHIDVPERRKPNIEWQEHARQELWGIYRSTEYMTARLQIGRILLMGSLSRLSSRLMSDTKDRVNRFFDPYEY